MNNSRKIVIFVPKIIVMTTLQINANTPDAMRFLEYARTLPFIREKQEESLERIPGLAYTHEERIASALQGLEDYRAGRVISNEEMGKWISELR
jgi:hypothetical protein